MGKLREVTMAVGGDTGPIKADDDNLAEYEKLDKVPGSLSINSKRHNVITIGRCDDRNLVMGWKSLGETGNVFYQKRENGYFEIRITDVDKNVSANHCVIYKNAADGNYYVYDGDYGVSNGRFRRGVVDAIQKRPSRNGTRVNDALIAHIGQAGERQLKSGDEITVGTIILKIILL